MVSLVRNAQMMTSVDSTSLTQNNYYNITETGECYIQLVL